MWLFIGHKTETKYFLWEIDTERFAVCARTEYLMFGQVNKVVLIWSTECMDMQVDVLCY